MVDLFKIYMIIIKSYNISFPLICFETKIALCAFKFYFNQRNEAYLQTPMTEVKSRGLPGIRLVKMNSNLKSTI